MNNKVIVTLIHGTFAHDADWTNPGSYLYGFLYDLLGDRGEIRKLDWSGNNTVKSRYFAAIKLRNEIRASIVEYNGKVSHFIIGHSHGGNIALYAMDNEVNAYVKGIYCLSTPIVNISKRKVGNITSKYYYLAPLGIIPWIQGYIEDAASFYFSQFAVEDVSFAILILLVCLLIAFTKVIIKYCDDMYNMVTYPLDYINSDNVHFFRTTNDEATAGLSFVNFTSWLITKLVIKPVNILYLFADLLSSKTEIKKSEWLFCKLFVWLPTLIIYYLMSALLFPLLIVYSFQAFFCGFDLFLYGFYYNLSIESTLPGKWSITTFEDSNYYDENDDRPETLCHSEIYNNILSIEDISNEIAHKISKDIKL